MHYVLLLIISRLSLIFSYYNNGKQILDLYEDFDDDVNYWTISTGGTKVYVCNTIKELGGYGNLNPNDYLERTYQNLAVHDTIVMTVSVFYNDSWDNEDSWALELDSKSFMFNGIFWRNVEGRVPNLCGAGFPDLGIVRFKIQTAHNSNTLRVRFTNKLTESWSNECFGVLEIAINAYNFGYTAPDTVVAYAIIVPSQATTTVCYPNYGPSPCIPNPVYCKESDEAGNCLLCLDKTYFFNGQTCEACPLFCTTCVDQDTCIVPHCPTNRIFYWDRDCVATCNFPLRFVDRNGAGTCTYPCAITGEFLYWDGTCQTTCNFPLVRRTYKDRQFCDFPCATNQILSQNGTCLDSCEAPNQLKTRHGVQFCETTCLMPNYLYWNGSCLSSCRDPPLTFTTDTAVNYCNYPCDLDEYLFNSGSNIGTCCEACDYPLTTSIEANRGYCDTSCPEPNWAYWNGSCFSICEYPLNQTTPCGANVCENLCSPPNYLYWNQSCLPTCTTPNFYTIDNSGYRYCNNPCFPPNYMYWNTSCLPSCDFPYKQRIQSGRYYCDFPCNSSQYLYTNGTCITRCTLPWKASYYQGNYFCDFPCPSTEYAFQNGSCTANCESPLRRIRWEGHNYCEFGCPDNYYLSFNGSCIPNCNPPFYPQPSGGNLYCNFPCRPPLALSWNGTCTLFCQKPLVQRMEFGNLYCDFPCLPNQWLTFEGKCIDACLPPRESRIVAERKLCVSLCGEGQAYHFNGSCVPLESCISPYLIQIVENNKICGFPCARNEYLYPDNACRKTCDLPWKIHPNSSVTSNYLYCEKPCKDGEFLYSNSSCLPFCEFPFVQKSLNQIMICYFDCRKPMIIEDKNCICPEGYVLSDDKTTCDRTDTIGSIIGATKSLGTVILSSAGIFLIGGASPTLIWGIVHLMQIFYYLVFMNVNYPESVEKFLQLFDLATLAFLPNPLDSWLGGKEYNKSAVIVANVTLDEEIFTELYSPPKFRTNNYSGTFLQSGGSFFQLWFIFFIVFALTKIIYNRMTDQKGGAYKVVRKLNSTFEWTGLIRIWLSTLLRMCFSSFLQVLALNFTSYRFGISSILGLLVAFFNIYFAVMAVHIVANLNTKYDEPKFKPLVENLRQGFIPRYYTIITIWKRILLSLSIIIFYYVPAIQSLIPLSLYMGQTLIIIIYRPYITINENLNEFITEFGLMIIHIIIMIYSWDDILAKDYADDYKENLGNLFILICILVLGIRFLNLLYGIIRSALLGAYNGLKTAYNNYIDNEEEAKKKPVAKKYMKKKKRVKAIEYGIKKLKIKVAHHSNF